MKRLVTLAGALLLLAFTQTLWSQTNKETPAGTFCGTDEAMARMPDHLKLMMDSAASASQVNDLLLYINLNPNGSIVRQGFGDADTLTSSIITGTRFCPAPTLSPEQADEIVRLVSDDFSPFNIRVTTDPAEFAAYPRSNKQMCLITTDPSVVGLSPTIAGAAPYRGIGVRLLGEFSFVFSSRLDNDPRQVAAVVSHEVGHLLGLGHQHLFSDSCAFLSEYHGGFGSGPLSFDPLMGLGLSDGINNWFAQSCLSPTEGRSQNDYNLINSQVAVRTDDFPDEPAGSVIGGNTVTGFLERAGDVDFIKINFRNPGPVVITSDNIDLKVTLLNPGGRVLGEFNDPAGTNVLIPSANDKRYLKIEAADNENMSNQFMIGTYRITY